MATRSILALIVILASVFAYIHVDGVGNGRASCERGNLLRDNQVFMLKTSRSVVAIAVQSKDKNLSDQFKAKLPEYDKRIAKLKPLNCKEYYKYFGIIK